MKGFLDGVRGLDGGFEEAAREWGGCEEFADGQMDEDGFK